MLIYTPQNCFESNEDCCKILQNDDATFHSVIRRCSIHKDITDERELNFIIQKENTEVFNFHRLVDDKLILPVENIDGVFQKVFPIVKYKGKGVDRKLYVKLPKEDKEKIKKHINKNIVLE